MGANSWGSSPLYVHLRVLVERIREVRAEGNYGRVTDRGKEAGAQSCEPTNRNSLSGQRAGSGGTKHRSLRCRPGGKGGGRAVAVRVLIWGDLHRRRPEGGERHDG